jgi:vacuolar-type H+-ATPase catalytic subunit A/Vma1
MNNFFVGGNDPLLNTQDVQTQLANLETYKQALQKVQQGYNMTGKSIWDEIDAEIEPLSDIQKQSLFQDESYADLNTQIQAVLQSEFLKLMKPYVEKNPEGRKLLEKQYDLVKKLKKTVVENTNKEMELFKKWQSYSAKNPQSTYEEFLKTVK